MKKITVSLFTIIMMLSMIFATNAFAIDAPGTVGVEYRGHIQNIGDFPTDGSWIQGPTKLGTEGQGLRLEGFWIQLNGEVPANAHIQYRVHVQNVGWMDPVQDGDFAGTKGKSLRIEAIEISLVNDAGMVLTDYSVVYSGHVQNIGDVGPYTNGEQLGTVGSSLRLEEISVQIVKNAVDLTAYNAALAAVTEADYTTASWDAYQAVVAANVVTTDNLISQVDAATAAITAAQANLVLMTKVTAISATDVNKIEVVFNQAITDQTAATFTLKKGFTNVNIASIEWSEDGTKVVITSAKDNLNTSDTDTVTYTLKITGLTEEPLVNTVDFDPEEEAALVITSESIELINSAPLYFEVQNQYGLSMDVSATEVTAVAENITQDADVELLPQDGESTFLMDEDFSEDAVVGDKIRVTLSYEDFTTEQTLTVGAPIPAPAPAAIELGTVAPLEGNTMIFEGDEDLVLPATITDQFGNPYVLNDMAPKGTEIVNIDGITFTSSDPEVVDVGTMYIDDEGVIEFTAGEEGEATITAVVEETDVTSTTTVVVNEEPTVSKMTVDAPTGLIAANDGEIDLGFVAEDQYGNVLDWNVEADRLLIEGIIPESSDEFVASAYKIHIDEAGILEVVLEGNPGEVTLTAYNPDDEEIGSVTFEVLEDAEPLSITGVKDITTTVTPNVATTIGAENLIIVDQYGRDFILNENEGATVSFKSETTALTLSGAIDSATGKATVTGTDIAGTATVVIALTDDGVLVPGGAFNVAITNLTGTQGIVGYEIEEIDTLYGFDGNESGSDYAKNLTVVGLDAAGNEVAIDQSKITALTSSNSGIVGIDSETNNVFGLKEGSATVAAWIGATKIAETVVTVSDEAPQGQTVVFAGATYEVTLGDVLDLTSELTVIDQYGVELPNPQALLTGIWTSSNKTVATVGNGVVTPVLAGNTTISFVLSNGNASGSVLVTVV
ncbi:MAG: hypothetical protein ACOH15_08540 [Acetobacterium sp.]